MIHDLTRFSFFAGGATDVGLHFFFLFRLFELILFFT